MRFLVLGAPTLQVTPLPVQSVRPEKCVQILMGQGSRLVSRGPTPWLAPLPVWTVRPGMPVPPQTPPS